LSHIVLRRNVDKMPSGDFVGDIRGTLRRRLSYAGNPRYVYRGLRQHEFA
jgi:hypothetical protein